jgi:hypothetical protein
MYVKSPKLPKQEKTLHSNHINPECLGRRNKILFEYYQDKRKFTHQNFYNSTLSPILILYKGSGNGYNSSEAFQIKKF